MKNWNFLAGEGKGFLGSKGTPFINFKGWVTRFQKFKKASHRTLVTTENISTLAQLENVSNSEELKYEEKKKRETS